MVTTTPAMCCLHRWGVIDTGDKHKIANISANFRKKIKTAPMVYSEAQRKLTHEKPDVENLVSERL